MNSVRRPLSAWASGAASVAMLAAVAVPLSGCAVPPAPAAVPPAPPPAAAPPMQPPPPAPAAALPEQFASDTELQITTLHRELAIQPGQEGLFAAYADAMRANAQATHALFLERTHATDFSAPARLRWYAQLTAAHATATGRLIAPFDALYQSLSDKQRAAADRYFEQFRQRRMPTRVRSR